MAIGRKYPNSRTYEAKHPEISCLRLDELALSNVWWSFAMFKDNLPSGSDKALVLWLNSTLGLMTIIATRDETEGAWVDFKKPSLSAMPVIDIRKLSDGKVAFLATEYDRISQVELLPLSQMNEDYARVQIDAAIAKALDLPDLSSLRKLLGREPVVCLKRL